jgi:hypothetical protein
MESKINRIIDIIHQLREDGAIGGAPTNSVGDGGLTSKGEKLAGYDKVMGLTRRKGIIGKGKFPGARTRWKKH